MDEKKIKVTVVGDGDTGKTCMLIVYKDKRFDDKYCPTIFDSYSMNVPIHNEDYTVILQDTAGQEGFESLRQLSYKDSDVFIVCYSINNRDSFENISHVWIPELKEICPTSKVILVGTKCDLDEERQVSFEDGSLLHKKINCYGFIENSAKFNRNIDATIRLALLSFVESNRTSKKLQKTRKSCCIM